MARVRSHDTAPELLVRRILTDLGYRYRLHRKDLPGKPDIAFIGKRKAIFVHGCFWHGHDCKRGARIPRSNTEYWSAKIDRNRARDALHRERLQDMQWSVLTLHECELKDRDRVASVLARFLAHPAPGSSL